MLQSIFRLLVLLLIFLPNAFSQEPYRRPPQSIMNVLNAPNLPVTLLSPNGRWLILAESLKYKLISDLAEPQLRLAGVRINPKSNTNHGSYYYVGFSIKKMPDGND